MILFYGKGPDRFNAGEKELSETFKQPRRIAQGSLPNVSLQCALGLNHSEDEAL